MMTSRTFLRTFTASASTSLKYVETKLHPGGVLTIRFSNEKKVETKFRTGMPCPSSIFRA